MKRPSFLLAVLLLGACRTTEPYDPVRDVRFTAIGHDPFWMVTIGDDSIALAVGRSPDMPGSGMIEHRYPRSLPRLVDGVRRWESVDGTAAITVEARDGPCEGAGGARYEQMVRVRLNGRELNGCGGRRLLERG
jgi:uncharacterized membrane protein